MKPGVTASPDASNVRSASMVSGATGPTWAIVSPRTSTSADRAGRPVPSTTVPPRMCQS